MADSALGRDLGSDGCRAGVADDGGASVLGAGSRLDGGEGAAGRRRVAVARCRWLAVEAVRDTGREEAVYNCRVAEYHTYFVGDAAWGWSLWAHNSYRIQDGVRRGVAAREVGVSRVYAEVFDAEGRLLRREAISLDELFSPKSQIARDARYIRIYGAMLTPQGRARIPPIAVIETAEVGGLTPLLQVILVP